MEIRVKDVDGVLGQIDKATERLRDALELLSATSSTIIHLNVDIYGTVDGPRFMIGFPDIKEPAASLRCIIHELEDVLEVFEHLPSEVAGLQKKISQP